MSELKLRPLKKPALSKDLKKGLFPLAAKRCAEEDWPNRGRGGLFRLRLCLRRSGRRR
jgi:hypothetical protein